MFNSNQTVLPFLFRLGQSFYLNSKNLDFTLHCKSKEIKNIFFRNEDLSPAASALEVTDHLEIDRYETRLVS